MTDQLPADQKFPTDVECLAAFRRGERVVNAYTMRTVPCKPGACDGHRWRTVVCIDDRDIIECSRCGEQMEIPCDFDEEYS